jgi:hypothetical protein
MHFYVLLLAAQSAPSPGNYLLYFFIIAVVWLPIGCWILGQLDGWKRLYRRFPAAADGRAGPKFTFLSGRIGLVQWRNTLVAQVTPEGLRLSVIFLFRPGHPPLLFPWSEIKHANRLRDFPWRDFVEFEIGAPRVTKIRLPAKVFAASPLAVPE